MSKMRTSRQKPKSNHSPDFKSVFIVDPVKGERLHLAKLLKQEKFLMMSSNANPTQLIGFILWDEPKNFLTGDIYKLHKITSVSK